MGDTSTTPRLNWLLDRVNKFRTERKLTEKWLYTTIGMTKTGYRQMWERDTVRIVTMQAIAKALRVTMLQLLGDEEPPALNAVSEPPAAYARPRYIEERLDELEQRMKALERAK